MGRTFFFAKSSSPFLKFRRNVLVFLHYCIAMVLGIVLDKCTTIFLLKTENVTFEVFDKGPMLRHFSKYQIMAWR